MPLLYTAAYGLLPTGRRELADSWGGVEGSRTLSRTQTVPYSYDGTGWEAYVPAKGAALTSPSMAWMTFDDFTLTELDACVGRATLVLNYSQKTTDPGAGPVTLPDDEVISSAAIEEISIAAHPRFSESNPAWGDHSMQDFWLDGSFPVTFPSGHPNAGEPFKLDDDTLLPDALKGMSTYVVGSGQVRSVEYSLTEPTGWIAAEAGYLQKPPGTWPGTFANWLVLSGDVTPQNNGAYWAKTLVIQYSERDFDDFVYSEPA